MNPNEYQPEQPVQAPYQQQPNQPQANSQPTQPVYGQAPPVVGQPVAYPQQPGQPYVSQQPYSPPKGPGNKKLLFGTIGGVVVLAIIVIVLFVALSHKNNNNSTSGNTAADLTSSSSSSSSASTSKTACDLFTLSNAQSLMGSSATAGSTSAPIKLADGTQSTCNYTGQGNIVQIMVTVDEATSTTSINNAYSAVQQSAGDATAVSGVGDRAFHSNNAATLYVQKGTVLLEISSGDQNGNDSQSTDVQVANTMISNF